MGRYTFAARIWVGTVAMAAVVVTALQVPQTAPIPADWLALTLLALCAAVAHVFPIRSASDGASYRLTNVFVVAGAVILPPVLLPPLCLLAITPDSWLRRRSPGGPVRWVFNGSQTALAAYATSASIGWIGGRELDDLRDVAVLLGGATLFTLVQAILVGLVISFNSHVPPLRADTFAPSALLGDGLRGALGITVAGLWLAKPVLLVLAPLFVIIAHRLTRNAHLAHLAQVDAKTGLHNDRHFERALVEELARSQRLGRPLAVLFADMDLLREVNNHHGHLAGDVVLRDTATVLKGALRQGDVVARFGGEEFVALLPGTDAEQATYLAERARAAVEGHRFLLDNGAALRCTISIGVATYPEDATDLTGLIKQADGAMYRAKQTRNAVARAQALPPVPRLSPPTEQPPAGPPQAPPSRSTLAPLALWTIVAAGTLVVGGSLLAVHRLGSWIALLPFLALAVGAEFLKVDVYEGNRQHKISLSFTMAVTMAAITVQPLGAPLVNLTAALVHVVMKRQWRVDKALFNLANPALAAAVASWVYILLGLAGMGFTLGRLAASLAAVLTYYLVNVGIVSLMISLHTGQPLSKVAREAAWFGPTNILIGLTGAFLGGAHAQIGLLGTMMFAVPVLVMRFTLVYYARNSQRTIESLRAAKAEVEGAHQEKEETLRKLIETVSLIIDARDNAVSGHSQRVAKYAVALGEELQLTPTELAFVHTAGLLHDLGKVAIPEAILHKPARLTEEEYETIKQHAGVGDRILSEVRPLAEVARMVGEHHERYDGGGYPSGKQGEAISIGGRILAVADTLDSILSDRPYSKGKPLSWALDEIDRCAGTHFDPDVVAALHRMVEAAGPASFCGTAHVGAEERLLVELVA